MAHLALRVDTAGPWLVDVGFGQLSQHPLRLDVRADQPDPAGTFRVTPGGHGTLEVSLDGVPQYLLEPLPRTLPEFEPTCWWQQTAPASHFTQSLVCSLLTPTGRVTLSERTLIQTDAAGRHEQVLSTDAEVLAAYRSIFGVVLDRVPSLATSPVGPGPVPASSRPTTARTGTS
jgi:N-hydroxyarylamine O-acetyltransferase